VDELLGGNRHTFRTVARMDKPTFGRLVILLKEAGLKESNFISVEEKILIHIQVCCAQSNRTVAQRFQHSGQTISKIVREVVATMRSVNHLFMVMPDDDTPTHDRIAADPKYAAFFGDCAGALDGTMVPAAISAEDAAMGSFRDRKKNISQNVLGVVNFDMTFQYILAGWEGSAHDGRVLRDAKMKGLPCPFGKFYLGDAAYALTRQCLTPYRGIRYHLKVLLILYLHMVFVDSLMSTGMGSCTSKADQS